MPSQPAVSESRSIEAAHQLAAIVNSSDDAIISKDLDGIIQSWNRAAERMFGYSEKEAVGRHVTLLIPENLRHEEDTILGRVRQGEQIVHFETMRRRKDGRLIQISLTVSPIRDAAGAVIGASKIARDISDRRTADETAYRLAAIVESSDDAIISKDLNGFIQSWNKGAEHIFGYTAAETIGRHITMLIPPDRRHEEDLIIGRIRAGVRTDHYETVRCRKGGGFINVSLTVSPVKDATGTIIGASKIARDITAQKKAEEVKELLLHEMKHRVKNMLSTIDAVASQTLRQAPAGVARDFSARIRALARAHDILTQHDWQAIDLGEIVHDSLLPFKERESGRLRFAGPPVPLDANKSLLMALAIHELATNAFKYGAWSNDAGTVTLDWKLAPDGKHVEMVWEEKGGPPVTPPEKRGFGSTLIQRALSQGEGKAGLDFAATGLVCRIRLLI